MEHDANSIQRAFSKRLKELRTGAGLTQKTLGDKLGASRGSISFYENCDRIPDITFLVAASSFFGVSPDYLLGLSGERSPDQSIQGACMATGFSADAIEKMRSWKELPEYRDIVNRLLLNDQFEEFLDNVKHYLMLSWAAHSQYGDSIRSLVHEDQKRAMEMIEKNAYSSLEVAYIALKSNLNHADISDFYRQKAQRNIMIILDDFTKEEKGRAESGEH